MMKSLWHSFCSAFLMYSRIPVPQVAWNEENRRYALCFFPWIGAVIGGILLLWNWILERSGMHVILFSSIAAVIPFWITGGIHLDGFCDVQDAKASYGTKEKRLEIMSDSHVGAFAVIHLVVYFLLQVGLFAQAAGHWAVIGICALGYIQARAWSGLAAVTFQSAKQTGALQQFRRPADKRVTIGTEIGYLILTAAGMLFLDLWSGIAAICCGVLTVLYYRWFSYRNFGGITGDLAGYFLQLCELAVGLGAVGGALAKEVVIG